MRTTTLHRLTAVSLTGIAAVGLAACGEDAPSVSGPSSQSSSSSSSSAPSSSSSSSSSSTSESTTPSSTTTSTQPPSTGTPGLAGLPAGCSATETPEGTILKFGQAASYPNRGANVCITVKKLEAAPASSMGTLKPADGKLYFVRVTFSNVDSPAAVHSRDINNLFLHPVFQKPNTGKALYSTVPGCDDSKDDQDIGKGQTGETCLAYQITGPTPKTVTYDGLDNATFLWK